MPNFLTELGIATDALHSEAERLRGDGATVVFVAVDGKLAGLLAIADPVKADDASGARSAARRKTSRS